MTLGFVPVMILLLLTRLISPPNDPLLLTYSLAPSGRLKVVMVVVKLELSVS